MTIKHKQYSPEDLEVVVKLLGEGMKTRNILWAKRLDTLQHSGPQPILGGMEYHLEAWVVTMQSQG